MAEGSTGAPAGQSFGASPHERTAFVFVCHAGEWELKAALLAASLRRHYGPDVQLIAAIPQPPDIWKTIAPGTATLLDRLHVRCAPITNPIEPSFAHANKIACIGIETPADVLVFLDSDTLCLSPCDFALGAGATIALKVADMRAFQLDDERGWKAVYAAAGQPLPERRVALSCDEGPSLPFYNSGVIALDTAFARTLQDVWTEASRRIRLDQRVPERRLWSDQLGLAVALEALDTIPSPLDVRHNHPTHLMPLEDTAAVAFAHYHRPAVIAQEPVLRGLVASLAEEHPVLSDLMHRHAEWSELAKPAPRRHTASRMPQQERTVLITGISRSGTSYLCSLIDAHSNAVGLNETPELLRALKGSLPPWSLPQYLRRVRSDILDGKPVRNKVKNGQVISDTAEEDRLGTYQPSVESHEFVVAAKNTFAFLSSLARLRHVMPQARFAICVRNPMDTIASWKASFAHLRQADFTIRPIGGPDDPNLSPRWREALEEIEATHDLAVRRAKLWRYLAERILEDRTNGHMLVRYEDLITNPMAVLGKLLDGLPAGTLTGLWQAPRPRDRRSVLDAEDLEAIATICAPIAAQIGVPCN
ncbi:MAG TPA: sulfotransferase [Hyphomicrobiaceae bacterium]